MLTDSNILVYAINVASPKHRKAQRFLQENIGRLVVAHRNIFETLRVLTHPKFPSPMQSRNAIATIERIVKTCRIILPNYQTHHIATELVKKHDLAGNQIFDGYLVATALANNITMIATDNVKDFKKFAEIKVINPFIEN